MINYFRNICLNQKQPNRTRNALSPDLEGRVSKFQNPASLFCLRIFRQKVLTLLHLTIVSFDPKMART